MSNAICTRAEQPSVDPEALTRLERFGGTKLLREMIAIFLVVAPERLAVVEAAILDGNLPRAEDALHSLKSSSAQLGAMALSRLSERGEACARDAMVTQVTELLAESRAELGRVEAWLSGEQAARCT